MDVGTRTLLLVVVVVVATSSAELTELESELAMLDKTEDCAELEEEALLGSAELDTMLDEELEEMTGLQSPYSG